MQIACLMIYALVLLQSLSCFFFLQGHPRLTAGPYQYHPWSNSGTRRVGLCTARADTLSSDDMGKVSEMWVLSP